MYVRMSFVGIKSTGTILIKLSRVDKFGPGLGFRLLIYGGSAYGVSSRHQKWVLYVVNFFHIELFWKIPLKVVENSKA